MPWRFSALFAGGFCPIPTGETHKGCFFVWGDVEDFYQPFDDLCRGVPFLRFNFAQGNGGATNLVCQLVAGQALAHSLSLEPLAEGYLSQRSLIPCINFVSLSDTQSDRRSCKLHLWDGVYHVENHEIPFRIFGVDEKYVDRFTPCASFIPQTPPGRRSKPM